ncbi:MAG: hypothetical protein ACLFVP_03335 [Candidatus Bathyarchaeia archaeon]
MGAVRRPGDELERKKEQLLRDLSPGVRETVKKLMENYQGKELERRLNNILSTEKTRELIERR